MVKVLIVTMHRGNNYGSALQTYALFKKIKELGHDPIVLDYVPERINLKKMIKYAAQQFFGLKGLKVKYNALRSILILISSYKCYNRFFNRELLLTKRFYSEREIEQRLPDADVYMTGSDQVWNSFHNQGIEDVFFLKFVPDIKPKVSYSASFGKDKLEPWEIDITRKYLNRYNFISVRESSAVDILKDMNISGVAVLDPTFLYDCAGWENKAVDSRERDSFVLVYSVEPDKRSIIHIAKEIANKIDAKVFMVEWGRKPYENVDKMISLVDPLMLIDYFLKAKFVVASSFHGTALAINLNRPFISLVPAKFNTRVESILNKVGLSDRLVTPESFDLEKALLPIDYMRVNAILSSERKYSEAVLKHSIECYD